MKNDPIKNTSDLRAYRILNFTLLQFMGILALIGFVGAIMVHYFF